MARRYFVDVMTCPKRWMDYRGTTEECPDDPNAPPPVRWESMGFWDWASQPEWHREWYEAPFDPEWSQKTVVYQTNHDYCGDILMDLSGWYEEPSDNPLQGGIGLPIANQDLRPLALVARADAPATWMASAHRDQSAWPVILTVLDAYRCKIELSVADAPHGRTPERYVVSLTAIVEGTTYPMLFDVGYHHANWCY